MRQAIKRTEFFVKLAEGTLPENCLKGYIVDDSLYLREYAKVFAWGMLHAQSMAEIRTIYSFLAYVNESEDSTRRQYLDLMMRELKTFRYVLKIKPI